MVFLMVSPKFITTFPLLPNPIPYLELESLKLWQHFFLVVSCFLITFLSLSIFSLNCARDCFMGLGFFLHLLVAKKSDFSVPSFLSYGNSFYCAFLYAPPCFLLRLQCFLVQAFFGALPLELLSGLLFPFLLLLEAFLLDCELDLSC